MPQKKNEKKLKSSSKKKIKSSSSTPPKKASTKKEIPPIKKVSSKKVESTFSSSTLTKKASTKKKKVTKKKEDSSSSEERKPKKVTKKKEDSSSSEERKPKKKKEKSSSTEEKKSTNPKLKSPNSIKVIEDPIINPQIKTTDNIKIKLPTASSGTLYPNDPFVLHFLLDGFASDKIGNTKDNSLYNFNSMLKFVDTPWSLALKKEIEVGSSYGFFSDVKKAVLEEGVDLEATIEEDAKNMPEIKENMIVSGGYNNYGISSHATAFRFLPKKKKIIFTNSGEGLRNHGKIEREGKTYYLLSQSWVFDTPSNFQKYTRRILAAVKSPYIDDINTAYQYQVNIKGMEKYYKTLTFKGGKSSISNSLWMTNDENWILEPNGYLYCLPQIVGSCTFHSIFWQLLLSKWGKEGYKAAEKLEQDCRNYVLDTALRIEKYDSSEAVSCLGLIVSLYHTFKRRKLALQFLTLESDFRMEYHLIPPEVTLELPVVEQLGINHTVNHIIHYIDTLRLNQTINLCMPTLRSLLKIIYSFMEEIQNNPNKVKHTEQQLFLYHIIHVASGAVKYVLKLDCTPHNDISLLHDSCLCLKIFKTLITKLRNYQNRFIPFRQTMANLLNIFVKLFYQYKNKLPPHSIPFNNASHLVGRRVDCDTIKYVRDYANYCFQFDLLNGDPRIGEWKKHTTVEKKNSNLKYIWSKSQLPIPLTFANFIRSTEINELVAFSILIYIMKDDKSYPNYKSTWNIDGESNTFKSLSSMSGDEDTVQIMPQSLGIVKDLELGVPLEELLYTNTEWPLPHTYGSLTYNCIHPLTETLVDTEVHVDAEAFYSLEEKWMKDVWMRTLPSIPGIVSNKRLLKLCCLWLFYLWPEGPPLPNYKNSFTLPIENKEDPLLTSMLSIWLEEEVITADVITQEKNLFTKRLKSILSGSSGLSNSKKIVTFGLFSEVLFYRRIKLYNILLGFDTSKLNPPNFKSGNIFVLGGVIKWPFDLKRLTWESGKAAKYILKGRNLVTYNVLKNNKSWLRAIYIQSQMYNIPSAFWQDKDIILEMHIGDNIFTISSTQFITPLGEVYTLVLPKDVPPLMRQWCSQYKHCFSLPLLQIEEGTEKWSFFLAGVDSFDRFRSVFDNAPEYTNTVNYEPTWYIYSMKNSGFMPILNRETPGWDFLVAHLIDSAKLSCLGIIRPFVGLMQKNNIGRTGNFNYIFQEKLIGLRGETLSHKDKAKYMQHSEKSIIKYPKEGSNEYKLWYAICSSISKIDIQKHIVLLYNIVCDHLKKEAQPKLQSQMLFEITSGLLMRPEQEKLLHLMWQDLVNGNATIRTALMGIGKSKVLVPLLVILSLSNEQPITVVQPEHLVPQTLATLDEIIPFLFNRESSNYTIVSDLGIKKLYLTSKINKTHFFNDIYLFDEIDNMYRPDRSEFNIPNTRTVHPIANLPMKEYYLYILDLVYETKSSNLTKFKPFPDFIKKITKNAALAHKMLYHLDYGLSEKEEEYLAVPYSAVNTPVVGATFSDIDMAALLSCLIRKKDGLARRDFTLLKFQLLRWKRVALLEEVFGYNIDDLLKLGSMELVTTYAKDINMQKLYLTQVLLPLKLYAFIDQYNLSFIDLMAPSFSTHRIGFSGTELMHVPDFSDYNWEEIVSDPVGEAKIKSAIIGTNKSNIYTYNKNTLYTELKNYDVLIDAGALLRKIEDPLTVVTRWAEAEGNSNVIYVFINKDHLAQEYSLHEKPPYKTYKYKEGIKFKWYFDQKHTLGTDLKLYPTAKALTLVRETSKLTDVAQAVFRLRGIKFDKKHNIKLDGQSTDFAFKGELPANRKELYTLLQKNDIKFKESLLSRHYTQNIKTVYREEKKNSLESYSQLVPYYENSTSLPKLKTEFGKWLLDKATPYLNKDINTIGVQHMQEYARENITELPIKVECEYPPHPVLLLLEDYNKISSLGELSSLNISVSDGVSRGTSDEPNYIPDRNLCFIYFKNGHCKIITLIEYLFLQARGYVLPKGNRFVFANSAVPDDTIMQPNYYISLAICGHYLAIHEQLIIITKLDAIVSMMDVNPAVTLLEKLMVCYYMDRFDVLMDYMRWKRGVGYEVKAKEYFKTFAINYDDFLGKWVHWTVKSDILLAYWKKCQKIMGISNK
jgi:hypothetical protein